MKVQVIEAMEPNRFENVIDAGAELLDALRDIMRSYGLPEEDAPAVICIAAGAALSVSPVPHKNFSEMIDMSSRMWRNDGPGLGSIELDPPHRREELRVPDNSGN